MTYAEDNPQIRTREHNPKSQIHLAFRFATAIVPVRCDATKELKMHTELILLANGYMEVACYDPWLPALRRHWVIRRTVDYSRICLQ